MARKKPEEYTWVRYIKNRVLQQNKNFIGAIVGPTGSGKSWSAISIGELVDPNFSEKNVVFSAQELFRRINSGDLSSGSVLVWDEAGVGLGSRDWRSRFNKIINYLLQTFRHRNFVLIFTVPYTSFIDAQSRKLLHAEFETQTVNRSLGTCTVKPKMMQYNPRLDKTYYKYLIVLKKGQGRCKIKRWRIPKPTTKLLNRYEFKKTAFTTKLNKDLAVELDRGEEAKLTENQRDILACWKNGIFLQVEIAKKLNTKQQYVSRNEISMRRKGFHKDIYEKQWKKKQEEKKKENL